MPRNESILDIIKRTFDDLTDEGLSSNVIENIYEYKHHFNYEDDLAFYWQVSNGLLTSAVIFESITPKFGLPTFNVIFEVDENNKGKENIDVLFDYAIHDFIDYIRANQGSDFYILSIADEEDQYTNEVLRKYISIVYHRIEGGLNQYELLVV